MSPRLPPAIAAGACIGIIAVPGRMAAGIDRGNDAAGAIAHEVESWPLETIIAAAGAVLY